MTAGQAAILGLIEGVTEYLPVSSTAHLILTEAALGLEGEAAAAFAVCVQSGAILAVLLVYRGRVAAMLRGVIGRDPAGLSLLLKLLAAFAPAAVLGVLLHKWIKIYLFGLWPIVATWVVGGLAMIAWDATAGRRRPPTTDSVEQMSYRQAVAIGLGQCLGLWPGVSRSLTTILGGQLAGLSLAASLEFGFLLGCGTLLAATAFDAIKSGRAMLEAYPVSSLAIGFAVAAVSAAVVVRWMLARLRAFGLAPFGWYRLGIAAVVAGLILAGRL